MRNLKRVLTIALAAVMLVAALAVGASAAGTKFTDVNANDEALYKAVSLLEGLGITKGTSDTTFGTNDDVTREQMAAFVYRLMNAGKSIEGGENHTLFEDLYDDTYYGMISWASNMGIIKGVSATEFNPDGKIILQDAYTMLVRALGYENDGKALVYPHDYIEIAEDKNIYLGEGLPSRVGYETKLTRGNVAVLLYNTFYADLAEKEVVEKPKLIGANSSNPKWVLETVEESPKLCEKVYNIVEERFEVRETTHYAFNDSATSKDYNPTEDSLGENTLLLVAVENDQKVGSIFTTLDKLGLSGKADNYIMSEITLYYTYDEDEEELTSVVFAEAHIDMQSASEISYGSKKGSGKTVDPENYYFPGSISGGVATDNTNPRMDGSIIVAGKTLYFIDAPYDFAKASYTGCETEQDRYDARNSENTQFIELKCLDAKKGLYTYYKTNETFVSNDDDNKLAIKFAQVRTRGVYEVDIFDPDGDGKYEYMWYKPASFTKIDMNSKKQFFSYQTNSGIVLESLDTPNPYMKKQVVPVVYANGAVLSGVAFNDGDFVIAYVNSAANYIDVMGVCVAQKGTVRKTDYSNGMFWLGNTVFNIPYQFLRVKNYPYEDNDSIFRTDSGWQVGHFNRITTNNALGDEVVVYSYKHDSFNHVMFVEEYTGNSSKYSGENLLIPIEKETMVVRNEQLEKEQYLKVLLDGEEKYILVDVEECYPAPKKTANGTYAFDNVVADENGKKYNVYYNKLCTYEVDKNGLYVIKSLFHGMDEDGNWDHVDLVYDKNTFLDDDRTRQAGNDLGIVNNDEEVFIKVRSGRYSIVDINGYSMLGTFGDDVGTDLWFEDAYVDSKTVFMIRTKIDNDSDGIVDEYEIKTYSGLTFPGATSKTTPLTNVQYIYENYGDSSKHANLVFFYGEVDDRLEFDRGLTRDGYRIVKSVSPIKVDDNEFRYSYDLFNINTGEVEEGVLGKTAKKKAVDLAAVTAPKPGSIVELTSDKTIDEAATVIDEINVDSNKNLVKFLEIVLDENFIELEAIRATDNGHFPEDSTGNVFNVFYLEDDVKVTLLKFGKKNDYETAEFSALELEALGADDIEDLKAFNSKYVDPQDEDAEITTEYAEFVKAYIVFDKRDRDDYPMIENIVVIVNDGEDTTLLDIEE